MVEVQQQNINGGLRFKEQPWCGNHITNSEPAATKNVYNYAVKNRNVEKTPMSRIAELTRHHKLKHEYVLLDESGPAHKKQFTVKLVLKPGEEYEGSGASIKKAQQSAAENALNKTYLHLPPRKQIKSKNETNPVWLLYSVASQLGLSVRFEEQVEVLPLSKSPFIMAPPVNTFPQMDNGRSPIFPFNNQNGQTNAFQSGLPPLLNGFNGYSQQNGSSVMFGREQKPEIVCGPWTALVNPMDANFNYNMSSSPANFQHNDSTFLGCMPNSLMSRVPPPTNRLNTPPPLIPFHSQMSVQPSVYRCCYLLSDGSEHRGEGRNLSAAKVDAALTALFHLRPQLIKIEAKLKDKQRGDSSDLQASDSQQIDDLLKQDEESSPSETDEDDELDDNGMCTIVCDGQDQNKKEDEPRQRRPKPKSVVSQIHECAYRLKMNVEFEVVKETGEPHNRRYVLRCSLSSPHSQQPPIVAVGEGSSKKVAKQNACQLMLDNIKGMDNDAVYLASVIVKQATKKATPAALNGKDTKRKTIIKDMKKDPQYGQHINPISRLIQVMQSRKESEPVFQLIGERGQNRYREFVVQVTCKDMVQTGVGPNKKLAKRAAAVAMLEQIGYVKPMPQPGKSLLKKRSSDSIQTQVEIGVFDPNDFSGNQRDFYGNQQKFRQFSPDTTENVNFSIDSNLPDPSTETFADVDTVLAQEINQLRFSSDSMSPPATIEQSRTISESEKQQEDLQPIRSQKRRVTFSMQVSACPPPEDMNYPDATIAPLKSEVVLVTKLKKRGRDSKKALTQEEKYNIAATCRLFCQLPNGQESRTGYMPNECGPKPISPENDYLEFGQSSTMSPIQTPPTPNTEFQSLGMSNNIQHPLSITPPSMISGVPMSIEMISPTQLPMDLVVRDAKHCLERLAKHYRFTVSYSDFPKGSMNECFSLVTIGLDKPILCHGGGSSDELAHNDAAYNAILHLSGIDAPKPTSN